MNLNTNIYELKNTNFDTLGVRQLDIQTTEPNLINGTLAESWILGCGKSRSCFDPWLQVAMVWPKKMGFFGSVWTTVATSCAFSKKIACD